MELIDIEKKPVEELKKILDTNNYFRPGALWIDSYNQIHKILSSYKKTRCVTLITSTKELNTPDKSSLEPFNYERYLKYKDERLRDAPFINDTTKLKKYITNSLTNIIHPDNFDIIINNSRTLELTIYYPEIKITNSLEMEHTMLDVYVRYLFTYTSAKKWQLFNISLFRGTYTPAEVLADYMFSHTAEYPGKITNDFCYGYTPLSEKISKMHQKLNVTDITLLVLNFHAYLQWESIEGTPYKYISRIINYNIDELEYNLDTEEEDYYINYVIKTMEDFEYSYELIDDDDYIIKLTPTTISKIEKLVLDKLIRKRHKGLIGKRHGDKFGILKNIDADSISFSGRSSFIFKENEILPIIKENNNVNIDEMNASIPDSPHPKLIRVIVNKIEEMFLEYMIKIKVK